MAERRPVNYRRQKNRIKMFTKGNFYDYSLVFIVLFLVAFGLIMVFSASSYKAELDPEIADAAYYLKRQGVFAILGTAAMLFVARLDYHWWKKWTLLMMYGTIFLLILVLLVGDDSHGATRWIGVGPIRFQPSEAAKIVIILFTAHMAMIKAARIREFKIMLKVMLFPMVAVALIAVENLSTAIICAAIALMIVFVTSPEVKQFVIIGVIVVALMGIFLLAASYRLDRIKVWLDPEAYENGYQTLQALYAIGSGGIFGKGLGQSIQKLDFLPESHNDMIFSIICEELGLFGAICVVALFVLLIWKCVTIALSAPDLFGALIVVGVITHIAVQVIINIAVVTNSIPPTGVPLPFISYGGTALFGLMIEMGLVLSVARQIRVPKEY